MVASWGGYSFIINLIPIHCLACIFTGRLSTRLYVAYAPFIVMGTLEAGVLEFLSIAACVCICTHHQHVPVMVSLRGVYGSGGLVITDLGDVQI